MLPIPSGLPSVRLSVGPIRQARPAARFDKTPANTPRPAPILGEHSKTILTELGYSDPEISAMATNKIVTGTGL